MTDKADKADKKTVPAPEPAPEPPQPAKPIDQAEHGRVRRPHGGTAGEGQQIKTAKE